MDVIENYEIKLDELKKHFDSNDWETLSKEPNGIQQMLGISDAALERFYTIGCKLLEERRWEDARDVFRFLTLLNPFVHNFWMGLGIGEQTSGNYEQAGIAYVMGEATDPDDPVVHANAYQCYLALGDTVLAERSFKRALKSCERCGNEELRENLINYKANMAK
ncbi:MAG: hypothetical protein H0X51_09835 [Parachlamydiaceae bacterium]|nr:hypothetical protein [Parachlamydiaceae bacterium]